MKSKNIFEFRKRTRSARINSRRQPPGTVPGFISIPEDAQPPVIKVFSYRESFFEEIVIKDFESLKAHLEKSKGVITWIDIQGIGDKKLMEDLACYFSIHKLQMEDAVNNYQRPKVEEDDNHLFVISRMLYRNVEGAIINEQMSFFMGRNFLITIQEIYGDMLDPVRERIRKGKGYVRTKGTDYLLYALMDAITDHYFPVLESIGEKLEVLEEELLENPSRESMYKIQHIKRELILMRRVIWPERDKINELLRSSSPLIQENTKLFFRDIYDHSIQVMDIVENHKELTASNMDIYLSSVSNKMNQVMKVLTIISTIFIPLTFIVGVYGMNFAYIDPVTNKRLPYNMPELYWPYGYIGVFAIMAIIAIVQLLIFYKKGWLTSKNRD